VRPHFGYHTRSTAALVLTSIPIATSGTPCNSKKVPSCYHAGMTRKTTTVRMPEELAETAEVVARGRGISVNALILEALEAEIGRVKQDAEFMDQLRSLAERDKEILDRLAE